MEIFDHEIDENNFPHIYAKYRGHAELLKKYIDEVSEQYGWRDSHIVIMKIEADLEYAVEKAKTDKKQGNINRKA